MHEWTKGPLLMAAALAVGVGCGAASVNSPAASVTPGNGLVVAPSSARLAPGGTVGFSATGAAAAPPITWTVQEGPAGGTVSSAGVYTAPSLNGTFHVVASTSGPNSVTASATVMVAGQPPPTSGAPMTAAHRTSGVAPLSVFFDAVDTVPAGAPAPYTWSSGVYQPTDGDYEAVHYAWDFGDPGAGVWSTTGVSRNVATGYTAAHVYESPGTYTASLTVTAKDGTVYTYQQTITVSAFGGRTYYVSAAGSDANDGLSESTPFLTAAKGFSVANAANRRILFRRGDTFAMAEAYISANGPGIIGAYGTGSPPTLVSNGATAITIRGADWRVMDIVFPGNSPGNQTAVAFDVSYQTVNALLLRLSTPGNWAVGIGWGDYDPIFTTPHDGATVMECEVANSTINGMYLGGRRLAILGNNIHDMPTSHVLRVWQAHKGVIAHNRLWNPGDTRHALKLHGNNAANESTKPETRWVTVSDNLVRGKTWSVAIGPSGGDTDSRLNHIIFERNRFWGEPSVQVDLIIWARHVVVRNNIFDGTGSSAGYNAVAVERRAIEPPPLDVRIVGNTIVRTESATALVGVSVTPDAQAVVVRNNLVSGPRVGTKSVVSGTGGSGFVSDHNSLEPSPGLANPPAGDYQLLIGSPAVDAGTSLPELRTDYFGAPRQRGVGPDIGAVESR